MSEPPYIPKGVNPPALRIRLEDLPRYQPVDPVQRSVAKESAFSKPGSMTQKPGKWKPAHGTRFRPTNEKARGRPRVRKRDPRSVKFY